MLCNFYKTSCKLGVFVYSLKITLSSVYEGLHGSETEENTNTRQAGITIVV